MSKHVTARCLRRLGHDNIFSRWHDLQNDMRRTDHADRVFVWADWYNQNYCKVLVDNVHWLKGKGITAPSVFSEVTSQNGPYYGDDDMRKIKRGFQRYALMALKRIQSPNAVERIRHKVERWHDIMWGLSGHPGHYSPRIARRLVQLASLVAPRVHAAVFTSLWNGWCTHRRFQRRHWPTNVCLFHCGGKAEDSLEHYCRCPVVHRVARHLLHIDYPNEIALDLWSLNSSWLDSPHHFRSLAILVYGTYMAFNTSRYNKMPDSQQAFHCIVQHCKQGALGHADCMSHLDSCWKRPMNHIC
jgi:hypothetical protein